MKPKELFVGALVCAESPSGICEVKEILSDCWIDTKGVRHDYERTEPIPLTPKFFEKNGFIEDVREADPTFPKSVFISEVEGKYRIEITWYDFHDVYEPNTGQYLHAAPEEWFLEIWSRGGNYDCSKPKLHVHELQHALRICGIEKEIVLF